MFKIFGYVFAVACFSSSLSAFAGCPDDLNAAKKKADDAVSAYTAAANACKKVNPACPATGATKSLYEKVMAAGAARGAANNALEDVKKRCPQARGNNNRLPGFL
jgi:hypothetical protein